MRFIEKYVGKRWSKVNSIPNRNWWTSSTLRDHIDRQISASEQTGVPGLLSEVAGGRKLKHGLSIGAGNGAKERKLLKYDLVEHFTLYELAETRATEAYRAAASEGLSNRIKVRVENAFDVVAVDQYDLVYWDHSLHHMMDVDAAVNWSVRALKPGGILLINDYIGATRLQFSRAEINRARQFLVENSGKIDSTPEQLRFRTPLTRLRQFLRDPSEAPQSDLIEAAVQRHCESAMTRIGGAMIHLLARFVISSSEHNRLELEQRLIKFDLDAKQDGFSHFATLAWTKPTQ